MRGWQGAGLAVVTLMMLMGALGTVKALPIGVPRLSAGPGTGIALANDGSYACENVNLLVSVEYFPDNHATVDYTWVGQLPSCMHNGGSSSVGVVSYDLSQVPPVGFTFACNGNAATGLDCGNGIVRIGPNQGPGSTVWIVAATAAERFTGAFQPSI